jgi:serine/threonine protein kinase
VGDFGLARQAAVTHPSKTHASTRHMAGTYGFICPEYASTGHFDARCDVYSFGVVCLQMLTGLPAITEEGTALAAALKRDFQVRTTERIANVFNCPNCRQGALDRFRAVD